MLKKEMYLARRAGIQRRSVPIAVGLCNMPASKRDNSLQILKSSWMPFAAVADRCKNAFDVLFHLLAVRSRVFPNGCHMRIA